MRWLVVALVMVGLATSSARAAPPTLSPTGELEAREYCVQYMDFTNAVRGSALDGLADSIATLGYDKDGLATSERWWRMDSPIRVVSHAYDAAGRLETTTWRLTDNKLVLTIEYRRDRAGNEVAAITKYPNGRHFKSTKKRDKHGRVIEAREVGESGTMMSRRYRYEDGRISEELFDRTGNGKVDETTKFSYDERGQLAEKVRKLRGDYADQHITFKYDKRGQLIERMNTHLWPTRPKWNGPREVMTYKYDAAGNLTEVERRITPTTAVMTRWIYDYSCHGGAAAKQSMPAAKCRASYPSCGTP